METQNLVKYIVDRAGGIIFRNEVQLGLPTGYLKTQIALNLYFRKLGAFLNWFGRGKLMVKLGFFVEIFES